MAKQSEDEMVEISQPFTNERGERIVHRIPRWLAEMQAKKQARSDRRVLYPVVVIDCAEGRGVMKYSFCETVAAMGAWHIRKLTDQGKKFGGGADTKTLCGLTAAWDVQCEFSDEGLEMIERAVPRHEAGRPCPACVEAYKEGRKPR